MPITTIVRSLPFALAVYAGALYLGTAFVLADIHWLTSVWEWAVPARFFYVCLGAIGSGFAMVIWSIFR